jgi:acyl-CoA synthetase (AMP-forming)/AMP-acid ligase II/acyl carrier protein
MAQQDPVVSQLDWLASDEIDMAESAAWRPQPIDAAGTAFLQYTSGSTSDPKGVVVSHANLLANLEAIRQAFRIEEDAAAAGEPATGVFWLPAYHDMGLIGGILTPLYVGGRSVLMSPTAFLQRPIRWLEAIDRFHAVISGAPNFAYDYCVRRIDPRKRKSLRLDSWRLAFCGAEPIRAETIREFTEAFAESGFRADAFYPCYGLAENTLLAAGPAGHRPPTILAVERSALAQGQVQVASADTPSNNIQELVGCGEPADCHAIEIVDTQTGRPCPSDCVGEILVTGPSVAQGYWQHPELSAEVFEASIAGRPGRYLRTGDLGFFHDGELFVTGRVKDVIIIRGRNHYPQDIEATVEASHPSLLPGAAFALGDEGDLRLAVVHQIDRQFPASEYESVIRAIRQAIAEQHEIETAVVVLIRQSSLPITSSGKVQRSLCRQQYENGQLKIMHEWRAAVREGANAEVPTKPRRQPTTATRGSGDAFSVDRVAERIEVWMQEWLVDRAGLAPEDVSRDRPFAEFGVDSMTAVELSQELEDEFGVPLPPIVAWNYPTPAALSRYLAEQTCGAKVEATPAEPTTDNDVEALLAEIENLSDDEVRRLLGESET